MKKILIAVSMMLLGFSGAYAAGTASGTQVLNSVTLNYNVALIPQTPITASDGTGFLVDNAVDFTVANNDGAQIVVTPGSTGQITNWTLANTGNAVQYFTLAAINLPNGSTVYGNADTADTSTPYTITYSTDGGTTYIPYTGVFQIAVDTSVLVRVAADIPLSVTNGQVMNIQLEATATDSGGTALTSTIGPDNIGTVDIVLAEGTGITTEGNTAFDGQFSAWGGYIVQSSTMSVTKTSMVISDPVNNTTNPKRIPGATIRYCFTVDNTGLLSATSVVLTEDFTTTNKNNLTYVNSGFVVQNIGTSCDCAGITDTSGTFVTPTVTINIGTLTGSLVPATSRACAYIEATIN